MVRDGAMKAVFDLGGQSGKAIDPARLHATGADDTRNATVDQGRRALYRQRSAQSVAPPSIAQLSRAPVASRQDRIRLQRAATTRGTQALSAALDTVLTCTTEPRSANGDAA